MKSFPLKDKNFIWHPYTQHLLEPDPIVVERAKGSSLYTSEGKQILDLISSWWTTTHGHSHEELNNALAKQSVKLEHVMFAGFTHPAAIQTASKLLETLPKNLKKVFFSDNGSTAVEVALKIAYQWWQNNGERRNQIIAFEGAYHGDTFGAMALGERNIFNESFEKLMFPVKRVPWPSTWIGDENIEKKEEVSIRKLCELLKQPTVAVIVEPILQGAGGMNMVRPKFIKKVSELVSDHNSLLIADEVLTGFGRTGSLFAFQQAKIQPDLIAISKGLTSGFLPMGITLSKEKIFQSFVSDTPEKTFWHGHSFTANPLGCAAANASLDLLENEPNKYLRFQEKHLCLTKKLKHLSFVKKIRICGTIVAFDLEIGANSGYLNTIGKKIKSRAIEKGLFIRPLGNIIYLLPPLCITDTQLEKSYEIIHDIISNL